MPIDPLELIYAAIDEVNAQIEDQPPIRKSPDTVLFGDSGLDSLTLVNVISTLEQEIQGRTGKTIVVIDEEIFSQAEGPLRTVGTLCDHLRGLLN
jgi:acyl carrier protein